MATTPTTKGSTVAKHIMAASMNGTRDGQDWPKVGEPAPAFLVGDELAQAVAHGWVVEAKSKAPVETATDTGDVETATTDTKPKPRARKGLTSGDF